MGRRRLPALLALVAGLLLGAGPGAQGVVASALHQAGVHSAQATGTPHAAGDQAGARGTGRGSAPDAAVVPATPHPVAGAALRAGSSSLAGNHLREVVVVSNLALLAVALAAFLVRQRRRSRAPAWHRATLFARGPPLLLAP
jgi:hypothetical protein